jgi:hypothetical protein
MMALAYRIDGRLWIRAQFDFVAEPEHKYWILVGKRSFLIENVIRVESLLSLNGLAFSFEKILAIVGIDITYLVITGAENDNLRWVDELTFHPSVFAPFFDFLRNTDIPPFAMGTYQKPERLAIFTHVHNDLESLKIWETHYSKFVSYTDLYVIDHGSSRRLSEILHPNTQVVSIPRGAIDHINISQFCGHFQRFLLSQYRWVMHVDSDEIVFHEQGIEAFLRKLDAVGYGPIVRPGNAVDLIDHTDGTEPLDPSLPISMQRYVTNGAPLYKKPILACEPTTWGLGFHWAFEGNKITDDPALWLIHIRYADLQMAVRREGIWTDTVGTESARRFTPQSDRHPTLDGLRNKVSRLLSDDRSVIPDRVRGAF